MKKVFLIILPTLLVSCAGHGGSDKVKEDSIAKADSIAQIETARIAAEQARLDSIRRDSIMQTEIDKLYLSGLTVKAGKPSETWIPDQTDPNITLSVTVTNNTGINLANGEYTISYSVTEMIQDGDYLVDGYRTGHKNGSALLAGETKTENVFEQCVLKISKPKAKLKISKEEFARRYREANKDSIR